MWVKVNLDGWMDRWINPGSIHKLSMAWFIPLTQGTNVSKEKDLTERCTCACNRVQTLYTSRAHNILLSVAPLHC